MDAEPPVEQYIYDRELGAGSFGKCWLATDKADGERVAVKFIPRGRKIDRNVEREVMYHSQLHHANVVGFKRVFTTPESLCLVLEYANGGELFDKVKAAGCFKEDMARFFFQQLLSGVEYLHECGVAHRDLKLENTLIKMEQSSPDRSPTPVLKISDFGFCKHDQLDTPPKSRVGTPAYISPEVLSAPQKYNGKAADVWAGGVHLYIMLVGWYPFTDPRHPHDFARTANNIMRGRFAFPTKIAISEECKELITRMLHRDPDRRITIPEIQEHPWYRKNLSREIADKGRGLPCYPPCTQPLDDIQRVLREAATLPGEDNSYAPAPAAMEAA